MPAGLLRKIPYGGWAWLSVPASCMQHPSFPQHLAHLALNHVLSLFLNFVPGSLYTEIGSLSSRISKAFFNKTTFQVSESKTLPPCLHHCIRPGDNERTKRDSRVSWLHPCCASKRTVPRKLSDNQSPHSQMVKYTASETEWLDSPQGL